MSRDEKRGLTLTQSAGEVEKVANVAAVAPVGQDSLQSGGRERKEGRKDIPQPE